MQESIDIMSEVSSSMTCPQSLAVSRAPVCAQAPRYPGPRSVASSDNWQLADIEVGKVGDSVKPLLYCSLPAKTERRGGLSLLNAGPWKLTGLLNMEHFKCPSKYRVLCYQLVYVSSAPAPQWTFQDYGILNINLFWCYSYKCYSKRKFSWTKVFCYQKQYLLFDTARWISWVLSKHPEPCHTVVAGEAVALLVPPLHPGRGKPVMDLINNGQQNNRGLHLSLEHWPKVAKLLK